MKDKYIVKSDRYNYTHRFEKLNLSEYYIFVPEEKWMPLYITYDENRKIKFIDTEGGPCIEKGFSTNEVIVEDIFVIGNEIIFKLKEICVTKTKRQN